MGIYFNGNVEINGNVEMYENGSMKITNQLNVDISDLPKFIEEKLKYSSNKTEYLEAAATLEDSNEPNKIREAITKLSGMTKELGRTVMFTGLSQTIVGIIKEAIR